MIEFFQITGSASFAARMALEEAGAAYEEVNIHPRRRDEPASFGEVNPLKRVPALREGDVTVYETGAVLLHLVDRFPERDLGPAVGDPKRAELYRWILWLADTLHPAWWPIMRSPSSEPEEAALAALRSQGRAQMDVHGAYLERELAKGPWCLGEQFSVADLYLYMLTGWQWPARLTPAPPGGGRALSSPHGDPACDCTPARAARACRARAGGSAGA